VTSKCTRPRLAAAVARPDPSETPPQPLSPGRADLPPVHYWCHSVPCFQFQALFTLISKFFAFFVHTTCSLSVSQLYLALEEIYLPFYAGVPTNTTRQRRNIRRAVPGLCTGLSPSVIARRKAIVPRHSATMRLRKTTIRSELNRPDFKFVLYPLHSPLLRVSLLFSFPPVNDMLKFTG